MKAGLKLPDVTFMTRVRDESVEGPNPYRWQPLTTADYFAGKRVVLFALPGAFTPTCSTFRGLPEFENGFADFAAQGIDAIYCLSVNDAFVMNKWAEAQGLTNVTVIPDGSGEFTRRMGMLVKMDIVGFGARSWRYAAVVDDGVGSRPRSKSPASAGQLPRLGSLRRLCPRERAFLPQDGQPGRRRLSPAQAVTRLRARATSCAPASAGDDARRREPGRTIGPGPPHQRQ